ncbi:MAG: DUF4372 domain-containing protein [Deltaproteobacteria bacterium]|nr:DUF4372 domain-containing protein [Deltaproteobacteria bacterium]
MVRTASIFSQILGCVDRAVFNRIVRRTQANRYTKRFTAWDHFVSMAFAQVAQAKSLLRNEQLMPPLIPLGPCDTCTLHKHRAF